MSLDMFLMQSAVDNEILKPSCTLEISTSVCIFKIVTIRILGSRGNPSSGKTNLSSIYKNTDTFARLVKHKDCTTRIGRKQLLKFVTLSKLRRFFLNPK